ncbi:MAG: RNA polymerase sigma factor [Myxococcota bacterium]|nr:RNA polymerase sigma factor [Myxococcota bacterium]
MRRANGGDADAYRCLLQEIGVVMQRYLQRRFGDSEFVEDCVQESLLAVHRARQTYDPRRSFRAWMFAIVRHKAIDLLRRRGTRGRFETTSEGQPEAVAAAVPAPGASLEAAELLRDLEPKYRDALVLTKLQGYSLADAASAAGVSVSAMKTRVHRAVRLVRKSLERESP